MHIDGYGLPEIYQKETLGRLALIYRDIQYVLKVPVVNFIFRTAALYENFLIQGWNQIRPSMLTQNMEKASGDLRQFTLSFPTPNQNWQLYYDALTIEAIKKTIFTFNYVNTKLLLIASAWSESLAHRKVKGGTPITGYVEPGIIPDLPPIHLLNVGSAPQNMKNLLLDIARVHRTYDVASDYRALAKYPMFLTEVWKHLRGHVVSNEYHLLTARIKEKSIQMVHDVMPFPVTIDRNELSHFYTDADIAGIMGIVSMFQNVLPGLIVDGKFFENSIHQ
jgi:hypothetical protein